MSSKADRKTYVLDTSVFIAAGAQPLFAFEGQRIVVPLVAIRELEALRDHPDKGYTARLALNAINEVSEKADEEVKNGEEAVYLDESVPLDKSGGTLTVELNHVSTSGLPETLRKASQDHDVRILAVAYNLQHVDGEDVTLISNDMPLRIIARSVRINAKEYVGTIHSYHGGDRSGIEQFYVSPEIIDSLYKNSENSIEVELEIPETSTLDVNYGLILNADNGENKSALVTVETYNKISGVVKLKLVKKRADIFGMTPRSSEQRFAFDHLMNDNVRIVSLGGRAGTGKTAIALAAGLEQVVEQRKYHKITVFRSLHAVGGQELGYLPGNEQEKMEPWAGAVWDAIGSFVSKEAQTEINPLVEVLPLTHIRGRTLNDAFIIIDEAQNLEVKDLMSALTRVGKNSKVILTWDISQRDNLRAGRHNGVSAATNKLFGNDLFAHTTLTRSERSDVAKLASLALEELCI